MSKYSEYTIENINTISYSEYIVENLDQRTDYSQYIADNLDKTISYSEYIAEQIHGVKGLNKAERAGIRKSKIESLFNEAG